MSGERAGRLPVRERLIQAGIRELHEHGIQDFSVRRVAAACGVSCGAPYKHFRDRLEYIAAIVEYVNGQWTMRLQAVVEQFPEDYRRQIVEVSLAYIRFLVENPHYRSILMLKDDSFDRRYRSLRVSLSEPMQTIIRRYCDRTSMPEEVRGWKQYVIRSLVYGAALMFDNGELEYNDLNMRYVAYAIEREFDLE